MKINGTSNNSFQNKVLLDTFVEQISALQEDVAHLQDTDVELDNKIGQKLSEEDFTEWQADAHVSNLHAAELNSETGFIGHLSSNQVDAENASLENAEVHNLTALNANIPSLTTDDVTVQGDITSAGNITAKDAVLDNVSATKVETPLIEADLVKADVLAEDVETDTATVKDKLTVKDVEVSGTVTGLSEINADSVNANEAEIETANIENIRSWISQVMNQEESMTPSPALVDNDRYTIELPRFNGVYLLSWEDGDVVWSATVIGNGKSYGISWGSRTDENFITDLFQYNGKLYIRVNSNGRLKFAYSATKELPQPVIYFNMVGWTSDKSLEQLCDEQSHIINMYPAGMIWFGKVIIPRLETVEGDEGAIKFKGSCTFNELPSLTDTDVGDVWNITNESYTDNRFVEGAGKPINAGDDVVAVEADMPVEYVDVDGTNWENYNYYQGYRPTITFVSSTGRLFYFDLNNRKYSDDNGETWIDADFGEITNVGYNFDMFETSTGTLLFSSHKGNYKYIFRSTDNGATWIGTSFNDAVNGITFFEDSHHRIWISPNPYSSAGTTISPSVRVSTDDGETFRVPSGLDATGKFYFLETDTGRIFITGLYRHFVPGVGTRDTFGMFYTDDFEHYTRCNFPSGKIPFSMIDNVSSSGVFRLYQFDGRIITSMPILDNIDDFASYLYYSDDNGETWNEVQCANNMIISGSGKNFYSTGDVVKIQDKLVTFGTDQRYDSQTRKYYWETRFAYSLNNGATWVAYSDTYTRYDKAITKLFVTSDNKRLMILGANVKYSDDAGKTINDTDFNTTYSNGGTYFNMYEKDKVLYFGQGYSEPNIRHDIIHTVAWDKFAAGVNYENFVAQNITASTSLKSEGTLEVDGTSQFDDDVTVTGDVTQTGDLNIIGNETLSGDLAVSGKVESDKLYGKELHVNDTGNATPVSSYLDASSTGITSNVNITENGNITQTGTYTATGNQTITGNLTRTGNETISGLVTIGELD